MSSTIPTDVRSALDSGLLGSPCPLGKIDHQLDQFFADDDTRTRASLANFAIYSEDPSHLLKNSELIREITSEHACRAILVTLAKDEAETKAASWISAHCHLDQTGAKSVCSEQVLFVLQGDSSRLVANIVLSHLRSDLPLIMWWQGGLTENFDAQLYSRIDRLIVDSCDWSDPTNQFTKLRDAVYQRGSRNSDRGQLHFPFHDLAFTRGHRHRLAIAHAFDNPVALRGLGSVNEVVISHLPGHRSVGVYIAAWLGTQLNAELGQIQGDTFHLQSSDGQMTIRLQGSATDEDPLQVVMSGPDLDLSISRAENPGFLQVHTQAGSQDVEELLPAPCTSECDLVSEVLMRGGNNLLLSKIFPAVLKMNGVEAPV